MVRARIIVSGRVQKAGYKDTVDEIAYYLGLKGYVKNLDDGTVEVVCEDEKEKIEKFVEKIKVREYPIFVEDIKVKYSGVTGEFKQFDIIREKDIVEATYDRMDMAARYMRGMNTEMKEMHHDLKDGQDKMLGKQDAMLGKQDKMLDGQSAMHGDIKDLRDITRDSFTELKNTYGVFHKTIVSMEGELVSTRKELSKLVDYIGVLVKEHIQKGENKTK